MIQPRRVPAKPGGDGDDSDRRHSIWQWIWVYRSSGLSRSESQYISLAFDQRIRQVLRASMASATI